MKGKLQQNVLREVFPSLDKKRGRVLEFLLKKDPHLLAFEMPIDRNKN